MSAAKHLRLTSVPRDSLPLQGVPQGQPPGAAITTCRLRSPMPSTCGVQASSDIVRKAIAHVKKQHPYWDRKNGADHFMVFSYDHGRCDMAPGLQHAEFGRMFAIQSYGDIMSLCAHMIPAPPASEHETGKGQEPALACFDGGLPDMAVYSAWEVPS